MKLYLTTATAMRLILPAMISATLVAACSTADKKTDDGIGEKLYKETESVYLSYIDSMKNAHDSTALHRITQALDDSLTHICMRYPPLSDTLITPDRQTRIYKLATTFSKLRKAKEKSFGNASDTII